MPVLSIPIEFYKVEKGQRSGYLYTASRGKIQDLRKTNLLPFYVNLWFRAGISSTCIGLGLSKAATQN